MSIGKAQALALADGFLDDIGSEKGFRPKELYSELIMLAGELVEASQDNLNKSNSNASGGLSASLVLNEPEHSGDIFKVDMMMNFYGRFINRGVKGTRSGKGQYQFKSEFPSLAMVEALKKGMSSAKKKTRNTNAHKSISANEKKNASISDTQNAYGAGRNIKMYGIEPTGFLDKAVVATQRKVKDRLGAALKIDIIDSITQL